MPSFSRSVSAKACRVCCMSFTVYGALLMIRRSLTLSDTGLPSALTRKLSARVFDNERAHRERMGGYGREHPSGQLGVEHGAADREVVGGASGGGGYYQAVAHIVERRAVVDAGCHAEHRRVVAARDGQLVEGCERVGERCSFLNYGC